MTDKLKFYREATFHISLIADDIKAMGDVFNYLRGVMPLHALSWHFYDRTNLSLRMEGVITPMGIFGLDNQSVPLSKDACKSADLVNVEHFVHFEHTAKDPLGKKIVQTMTRYIGPEDKSLLIIYLEWKNTPMGHLCIFRKEPGNWPTEQLELYEMLKPPFSFAIYHMRHLMELTMLKNRVTEEKEFLVQELRRITDHEMIGADSGLREIKTSIEQLALVDTPVLIIGETGVGKELVANAIQQASRRRDGPYVKVNCGAIPESLIDSELFGHEKGAFTGAVGLRKGKFELANEGTIFLDEIGELPPQAQVRLLRILQNHEVERVGGSRPIKVDVRFIAATHRNLLDLVKKGRFREDLFFRINVFPVTVPPLRHRMQDIPALVDHLIKKKTQDMKLRKIPKLEPNAIQSLLKQRWPGNVRELENLVERALILRPKGPVKFQDLLYSTPSMNKNRLDNNGMSFLPLDEVDRNHIKQALTIARGKINGPGGAAEILDVHPHTLRRRMDKLGINYGRKHIHEYATKIGDERIK